MTGNVERVGRYALGCRIAAGGMATVHLGRLVGSAGFSRTVAIKRLHPHLCDDPSFVEAFADEARLAARIRHPNVVPTLDVVRADGELLLVMEYVDGEALSALARAVPDRIPLPIVVAIVSEMLHGLHSAHEARSETGAPLDIVHRDVSPQNVLVGADGVARLVDFGIARAANRKAENTATSDVKGKLAYMAPEQLRREPVTRQADLFAAGVVLWELLTGQRLFASDAPNVTIEKILVGWVAPPSSIVRDIPPVFDEITARALDPDPALRFESARAMAVALEEAMGRALGREVGVWVERTAGAALAERRQRVGDAERLVGTGAPSLPHAEITDGATVRRTDRTPSSPPAENVPNAASPEPEPLASPVKAVPKRADVRRGVSISLLALAATLTLFFGARRVVAGEQPARPTPSVSVSVEAPFASATRTTDPPAVSLAAVERGKSVSAASVSALASPKPSLPAAHVDQRPTRPVEVVATPHARSASARSAKTTPCVAKLDPATRKKIYQGDCD